jgi:hypothetical protein
MTPNQRNLIAEFDSLGVRYLTIGGYCMRCHGFERKTFDIDLWVDRSATNAVQVALAIETLAPGHAPRGKTWREVFQLEACLVEYPSIGLEKEVDILTGLGTMQFGDCYTRSFVTEVDGISLRALCIHDLLASKNMALKLGTNLDGQLRDRSDHDLLRARLGSVPCT